MPNRFQYLGDPLFLAGLSLLALNEFVLKPHSMAVFLHHHFNDLLLIPCALPILLWLHRRLGLRTADGPPDMGEISLHLLVWCALFELAGPILSRQSTGDWRDVTVYCIGGVVAWGIWNRSSLGNTAPNTPAS